MAPQSKRRRINPPSSRPSTAIPSDPVIASPASTDPNAKSVNSSTVVTAQTSGVPLAVQQAKKHAILQAQQDGCMGSFRSFDSPYGNFLVPVIPTCAELSG
ncbi:hypothetical protein RJ641_026825 [Dillenia turbinata]|uniref:Uncharacterized protein n=1 Tax=Dillenia turbinata TaxID=194707 RepID=A0AAN8ZP29_9MAGN